MILDSTTKSLELVLGSAVTTTAMPVTVDYVDMTTTTTLAGSSDSQSNGVTLVTILAAPAASTQRKINLLTVYNADTASKAVTIRLNNNTTLRNIVVVTLQVGDTLAYTDTRGWYVIGTNGATKEGQAIAAEITFTPAGNVAATDLQAAVVELDTEKASLAQLHGRNLLINPSGEVYNRAVAATADDAYFADRWYALTQTGTVLPSVLASPEDGYNAGVRLTQSQASAQRFGYAQIIEGKDCKHLRGGSGTLVPRIRVSTSQAVRYAILGWTGTEDDVTSDVVLDWTSASYTAGGFFLAASVSVLGVGAVTPSANTWTSLTALTASMGSSFNNVIVMVWTEAVAAQNFTLDFDFHQLEQGTFTTTFERLYYEAELARCQRYLPAFNLSGTDALPGITNIISTSAGYAEIPFPVTARIKPTAVSYSAVGDFNINVLGVSNSVCTAITYNTITSKYVGVVLVTGTGTPYTANQGANLRCNGGTAKIIFDGCEL